MEATDEGGQTVGLPDGFFNQPRRERDRFVLSLVKRTDDGARGLQAAMREGHGDPATVPALRLIAELDPDEAVRRSAVFGLSRIADPSVIPTLRDALTAPDRATRAHAISGLGYQRSRDAVPNLIQTVQRDRYGRVLAAEALARIGDPAAAQAITSALRKAVPWRRRALRQALQQLEGNEAP